MKRPPGDVPGRQDLAAEEVHPAVRRKHRHALVVRREGGTHVEAEDGELDADEGEGHAQRQEGEGERRAGR